MSSSCEPMDCSLPGSSVHGILQARILKGVAISFSRDFPYPAIDPGSPALQVDSLPNELSGKPICQLKNLLIEEAEIAYNIVFWEKQILHPKPARLQIWFCFNKFYFITFIISLVFNNQLFFNTTHTTMMRMSRLLTPPIVIPWISAIYGFWQESKRNGAVISHNV